MGENLQNGSGNNEKSRNIFPGKSVEKYNSGFPFHDLMASSLWGSRKKKIRRMENLSLHGGPRHFLRCHCEKGGGGGEWTNKLNFTERWAN